MKKEKSVIELQTLEELSSNVERSLERAIRNLDAMGEIETTRDTAMVKTKVDEAMMWLGRYQGDILMDLAHKTCR